MTPDNMIDFMKLRLASSNDSSLNTSIITIANVVQERLEQEMILPWFLFVDTNIAGTNLATVENEESVALPANFLREVEELDYVLFVQDTDEDDPWVPLKKKDYSVIKARYTSTGRPKCYDILGDRLYLRGIPDAAYTLRLLYQASDDDIAAGTTENLWMKYASDWIMAEVGMILTSTVVPMPSLLQQFQGEVIRARTRVMNETVARQEAGYMRDMGDD